MFVRNPEKKNPSQDMAIRNPGKKNSRLRTCESGTQEKKNPHRRTCWSGTQEKNPISGHVGQEPRKEKPIVGRVNQEPRKRKPISGHVYLLIHKSLLSVQHSKLMKLMPVIVDMSLQQQQCQRQCCQLGLERLSVNHPYIKSSKCSEQQPGQDQVGQAAVDPENKVQQQLAGELKIRWFEVQQQQKIRQAWLWGVQEKHGRWWVVAGMWSNCQ